MLSLNEMIFLLVCFSILLIQLIIIVTVHNKTGSDEDE
jgi:hypothetical protein